MPAFDKNPGLRSAGIFDSIANVTPATDEVTSLTGVGGSAQNGAAFTTTHWSVVLAAQGPLQLA
jgi:hypothetical protein